MIFVRAVPCNYRVAENTWIRLFKISATYTFPRESMATPPGRLNCPLPEPGSKEFAARQPLIDDLSFNRRVYCCRHLLCMLSLPSPCKKNIDLIISIDSFTRSPFGFVRVILYGGKYIFDSSYHRSYSFPVEKRPLYYIIYYS